MRFIDEVTILVQGGDGGDGCVAFRREKYVPRGGPSGGDGGRGGDVIVRVNPGLSTLIDLRYQKQYRADRGTHGQGHDRYGRGGAPRLIEVPVGTMIYDADSGELLADLVEQGEDWTAAAGGAGGWGNIHFVSSTNRAPRRAEPGREGEKRNLRLELKLLAEGGLVGLPNAGKSTLISTVSAARPKIADYPFTTLVPSLGVVRVDEERSFVLADIPGLIEGAHQGAGLGKRFLRHIERTRVLVFLLDDRHTHEGTEGHPLEDLRVLFAELGSHDPSLLERQRLVVLNKSDLLTPERRIELAADFSKAEIELLFISAVTRAGLRDLVFRMGEAIHGGPTDVLDMDRETP